MPQRDAAEEPVADLHAGPGGSGALAPSATGIAHELAVAGVAAEAAAHATARALLAEGVCRLWRAVCRSVCGRMGPQQHTDDGDCVRHVSAPVRGQDGLFWTWSGAQGARRRSARFECLNAYI